MNEPAQPLDFNAYPYAMGRPALSGVLRFTPEDFFVEEVLGFSPDDDGPHFMLWIEKKGANTDWVAKQLARRAGCRPMDVGYAGMKDRNALTRQWFSVPAPKIPLDWSALDIEGVQVLEARAHRRKLRRGAHSANRFVLALREVRGEDDLDARLEQLRAQGVPNYFGPQRFGRHGDNVVRALDGARGAIYLSAARSFLFNAVLAERVASGNWNTLLPGEAVQLDGSGSFFIAEVIDATLAGRLQAFDVHPSGPLWGKGELPSREEAAALEMQVAGRLDALAGMLEKTGMRQERRALRLAVGGIKLTRPAHGTIVLEFELPPGAFATSVLRELINTVDRGERDAGTD